MEEKIIFNIESNIELLNSTPKHCIEFQAAKIEGAIDMAYSVDAITHAQFTELYKKLLNTKIKNLCK